MFRFLGLHGYCCTGIVAYGSKSLTLFSGGTNMEQKLKQWAMVHDSIDVACDDNFIPCNELQMFVLLRLIDVT